MNLTDECLVSEFGLEEADLELLPDGDPQARRKCAGALATVRDECRARGIAAYVRLITLSREGCCVLLSPKGECSMPFFAKRMAVAFGAQCWNHVPGLFGVVVEYPTEGAWEESLDDFCVRSRWCELASAATSLPLALGQGVLGDDVVLDLADMSHLLIVGGDTYAQDARTGGFLDSLFRCRPVGSMEFHLVEYDTLSIELSSRHLRGRGGFGLHKLRRASLRQDCYGACDEVSSVSAEVDVRRRLLDSCSCRDVWEYERKTGDRLPEVVLVVGVPSDCEIPPDSSDSGTRVAVDAFNQAVENLLYEDTQRLGIHLVLVCGLGRSGALAQMLDGIVGGSTGLRVGVVVISRQDQNLPNWRCGRETSKTNMKDHLIYRTPDDEVYRIHALGDPV